MNIPGMGFLKSLSEKGIKQTIADKFDKTTRAVREFSVPRTW